MSPATVALLRSMMRDEIRNGLGEMESKFAKKLDDSVQALRRELSTEREARAALEQRITKLEDRNAQTPPARAAQEDDVDKSVVVIGGFSDKTLEEVDTLMEELMIAVAGYREVEVVESTPPLALAKFDSSMRAMNFMKKNATMKEKNLWASENRSKEERLCCKAASKFKKYWL